MFVPYPVVATQFAVRQTRKHFYIFLYTTIGECMALWGKSNEPSILASILVSILASILVYFFNLYVMCK